MSSASILVAVTFTRKPEFSVMRRVKVLSFLLQLLRDTQQIKNKQLPRRSAVSGCPVFWPVYARPEAKLFTQLLLSLIPIGCSDWSKIQHLLSCISLPGLALPYSGVQHFLPPFCLLLKAY